MVLHENPHGILGLAGGFLVDEKRDKRLFCVRGPVNLEICLNLIIKRTVSFSIMAVVWVY